MRQSQLNNIPLTPKGFTLLKVKRILLGKYAVFEANQDSPYGGFLVAVYQPTRTNWFFFLDDDDTIPPTSPLMYRNFNPLAYVSYHAYPLKWALAKARMYQG